MPRLNPQLLHVHLLFSSTNPVGSVIVIPTTIATVVPTTAIVGTSTASSSPPTAAIVGGVVGGIAFLLAAALLFYCLRRRSNKDEFDGIFDPDRVVHHTGGGGTLPHVDLVDESNNITPFNAYTADAGQGVAQSQYNPYAHDAGQDMRQYGQPLVSGGPGSIGTAGTQAYQQSTSPPPPSSPSHYSDGQSYFHGSGGHSPQASFTARPPPGTGTAPFSQQPFNMHGAAPADWHTPRPGSSPPPSTVPSASVSSRSAKEREAMGGRGPYGLGLATQHEAPEGSSIRGSITSTSVPAPTASSPTPGPAPAGGAGLVVHQDAGRAPDAEEPPQEIPPSYDSIRQ